MKIVLLLAMLMIPVTLAADLSTGAVASVEQPQPPAGFEAVDDIPPGEQIPAINIVAAAYGFVWLALLGYVWSLARRLKTVEAELSDLESRKR